MAVQFLIVFDVGRIVESTYVHYKLRVLMKKRICLGYSQRIKCGTGEATERKGSMSLFSQCCIASCDWHSN